MDTSETTSAATPTTDSSATAADATPTTDRPASGDTTPTTVTPPTRPKRPRQIALRLSTVATTAAIFALLIATGAFASLYFRVQHDISARDARAAEDRHAQQIATDYALGASTIDYRDTKTWFNKLKADTTAQLAAKFDASAPQLEQILQPLQWTSKATPITSTVMSESGGVYQVSAFLNVNSTSVQTPQGGITTVAYTVTVDKNAGWKITQVGGGLDSALPAK
jgi:Mce-associated membrane protein